jgi:hypothetical protein
LKSNIAALSIHLTDKQIEYLESVQNFEIGFPGDFVGDDPRAGPAAPIIAASAPMAWAVSSLCIPITGLLLTCALQKYGKPIGHD